MMPELLRLISELAPSDNPQVAPDSHMIDDLAFDSFRLVELIGTLEERLGIELDDDDLVPENFFTPRDIERMLARATASRAHTA